MKSVTVYTKERCPYCVKAKALLTKKQVSFSEVNLEGKMDQAAELFARTGFRTVPQIFIGDECIGGCDDLYALDAEGKLDALLQ